MRSFPAEALLAGMEEADRARLLSLQEERRRLEAELRAVPEPPLVHAAAVGQLEPTHVLARGDVGRPGLRVSPGGIAAVRGLSPELGLAADAPDAARRLALSRLDRQPFQSALLARYGKPHLAVPFRGGIGGQP